MAEEIAYLRRELEKARGILSKVENRLAVLERKYLKESEEERLKELKQELKKEYPEMEFNEDSIKILKLVGTLPSIPISEEKKEIAEAIAERYE